MLTGSRHRLEDIEIVQVGEPTRLSVRSLGESRGVVGFVGVWIDRVPDSQGVGVLSVEVDVVRVRELEVVGSGLHGVDRRLDRVRPGVRSAGGEDIGELSQRRRVGLVIHLQVELDGRVHGGVVARRDVEQRASARNTDDVPVRRALVANLVFQRLVVRELRSCTRCACRVGRTGHRPSAVGRRTPLRVARDGDPDNEAEAK
jgi:hypothetical protein